MQLHTDILGKGRDLVLIHGWGMNSAVWSSLVAPLAQHCRLTLVDMPGHGESEYDRSQSDLDQWVDVVMQVVPERAIWIGWSLGSMLAQRAAACFPARVQGLVSIAGTPRFVQGDDWPNAMQRETLRGFAADLAEDHGRTLERFLTLQAHGDNEVRRLLRPLREGIGSRSEPDQWALDAGLNLLMNVDLRADLSRLRCPTMWLLGRRDALVPVAVAEDLRRLLPEAQIDVFPGAAHLPMLSDRTHFLELLQDFIGGF